MKIITLMEKVESVLGFRFACELHAAITNGSPDAREKLRMALKAIR